MSKVAIPWNWSIHRHWSRTLPIHSNIHNLHRGMGRWSRMEGIAQCKTAQSSVHQYRNTAPPTRTTYRWSRHRKSRRTVSRPRSLRHPHHSHSRPLGTDHLSTEQLNKVHINAEWVVCFEHTAEAICYPCLFATVVRPSVYILIQIYIFCHILPAECGGILFTTIFISFAHALPRSIIFLHKVRSHGIDCAEFILGTPCITRFVREIRNT